MTSRQENNVTYAQGWDAENRLTAVTNTTTLSVTKFIYDGDGNRVKKIAPNGQATIYIGAIFEKNVSTGVTTTYYFAGSTRITMRVYTAPNSSVVYFLAGDHLGSTSLTLNATGSKIGEMKYYPYGETRYSWGSTPTDRRFTGQRQEDAAALGSLYDFGARFYSPYLNRWTQPDTIVPDPSNPQTLNRYSYVNNNPVRYTDPSGHCIPSEDGKKCLPEQRHGFRFARLPVDKGDLDWITWYGTTEFAYKHPGEYAYSQGLHAGIDLGGDAGTQVRAGIFGKVLLKDRTGFGPGNITVRVMGPDGASYDVIYGHLTTESVNQFEIGDTVNPGTIIGSLADQGDNTHLHLEIRDGDGTNMFNPLRSIYEEDLDTLHTTARSQIDLGDAYKDGISFHAPTKSEDYLTYYGDPLRQPLVVHWGKSYWDK